MKIATLAAAAAACLMLANAAHAEGYVGLAGGPSKINGDCSGTSSCDTTGTGFKVFGGYKFTPNLAGEVVYMKFGKASVAVDSVSAKFKPAAIGLGGAYLADVAPNVHFAARLGVARVKTDVDVRVGSGAGSTSESTTASYGGLSIGYALSPSIVAMLSFDATRSKFGGESFSTNMFSIGLTASF